MEKPHGSIPLAVCTQNSFYTEKPFVQKEAGPVVIDLELLRQKQNTEHYSDKSVIWIHTFFLSAGVG